MEELEIMRQQLAAMKQSLDTQQIVNKDLLRKVMRSRSSWLTGLVITEMIINPLLFIFFAVISVAAGITIWYAVAFGVLSMVDTAVDWHTVRISPRVLGTASILQLKKRLLRQKKERFIQLCVSLPLALIWVVAFYLALLGSMDGTGNTSDNIIAGGVVSGIIGAAAGVIIVIILYRRMQRTNDAIIRDISDMKQQ